MRFGVDYYPEHWPESRWQTDARLMREAGFNVARLAEFAWSKLEPEEGTYDFGWLDRAIHLLGEHGIDVVLGTPTAIPPDWLIARHPDVLPQDEKGIVRSEGTRRHYRFGSATYRAFCARIARIMASHYADNPHVIGWQTDNEFGCHNTTYDYSDESRTLFQAWLRRKYVSLDELNRRWGTVFWSQTFHTWDAIPLPKYAPADPNPSLALDFRRWASETARDFQRIQVEILRAANPAWFITHNFMGLFDQIDGYQLCEDLNFASWDNYPVTTWGGGRADLANSAFAHDVTRGFKRRSFWVMEQQAGPTGAGVMAPAPRPGQIAYWAWQAIAHGADGIVFFRWRTCTVGAEQYWHGLLEHDGSARRRYREAAGLGAQLKLAGAQIEGAYVPADVAILRDFDSAWAYRIQGQVPGFSYDQELGSYHAALGRAHVNCDVISPTMIAAEGFAPYKIIIAPCLHLISNELAQKLRTWVEGGGVLIGSYRLGVKDMDNRVVDVPLPGVLRDVFGVVVEEYDPMGSTYVNHVMPEPTSTGGHLMGSMGWDTRLWSDVLRIESQSATALARYALDYYADQPAITMNKVGGGAAIYVGTSSTDNHFYNALIRHALSCAHVTPIAPGLTVPLHVELIKRVTPEGKTLLFALNGQADTVTISGTTGYVNILTDKAGEPLGPTLTLAPWGVAVLTKL